ncbi:MAG TPA: hypothetical protein VFJ09_17140 [Nocardioidaceae bacterium]|nr:hypothetical protein [Nocardioidaceae bacterium]
MSVTFTGQLARQLAGPRRAVPHSRPTRRVRQEVRDGLAVAAFTAAACSALAVVLAGLTRLAG